MCVLLCEHGIACALRWGVALVGVILTGHLLTSLWDPLSGAGYVQVADLIRDHRCEKRRTVALRNVFVKKN